jgi:hypothetical protein
MARRAPSPTRTRSARRSSRVRPADPGERTVRSILDLGMKLHVPYNRDPGLIAALRPLAGYIRAVYLPCDPRVLGTGRPHVVRDPGAYDKEVGAILDALRPLGIQVEMLFNGCYVEPRLVEQFSRTPLYFYLKRQVGRGLEWVTISHISLARAVRRYFPALKIDVSTVALVNSVDRAAYWRHEVAPDMYCVDDDGSRDLRLIQGLRQATGKPVKIIANSACLSSCPFKWVHQTHHARGENNPFNCWRVRAVFPWHAYHGLIIPPFYLRWYEGLVEDVKLVDRMYPTADILDLVRFYAEAIDSRHHLPRGGLMSGPGEPPKVGFCAKSIYHDSRTKHPWLRELPDEVFRKTAACRGDCARCDFCYRTWVKEWRVVEDMEALRRHLARVSQSPSDTTYYTRLLDDLHARMHDGAFLRLLHIRLGFCAPRYHDLLRYFLAIARAESGAPDLARRDAAAIGDPALRASLSAILRLLRGAAALRYLPADERDPLSFAFLAESRRSTAPDAPLRLLQFWCSAREEEQARPLVAALGRLDEKTSALLIAAALRSRLYWLVRDLCERFRPAAPDPAHVIAEATALWRTGGAWRPVFRGVGRVVPARLDTDLAFAYWRLSSATGGKPVRAKDVFRLVSFAELLDARGDLPYATEVIELALTARPRDPGLLRRHRDLLLDQNLRAAADEVAALVDPVTARLDAADPA